MQNSLQKFRWFSGKFVLPKSSDLCNYLLFFSFKALHLGHIAKCFGLRDPPSQITGIGKGNWVKKEAQKKVDLKREHKVIKAQETRINQKSLVMSEYSSGFEGANLDLEIKGVLGPKKESKKSITKKKLKRLK